MYNCDLCGSAVPAGTSRMSIVTETRNHQHPYRVKANRKPRPMPERYCQPGPDAPRWSPDDPGGVGSQIVKEKAVCQPCFDANGLMS